MPETELCHKGRELVFFNAVVASILLKLFAKVLLDGGALKPNDQGLNEQKKNFQLSANHSTELLLGLVQWHAHLRKKIVQLLATFLTPDAEPRGNIPEHICL